MIDLLHPAVGTTPARPGGPSGRAGAGDDAPADFASLLASLAGAIAGHAPGLAEDVAGGGADPAGTGVEEPATAEAPTPEGDASEVDQVLTGQATDRGEGADALQDPALPVTTREQVGQPAAHGGRPAGLGIAHRSEAAPAPAGASPGAADGAANPGEGPAPGPTGAPPDQGARARADAPARPAAPDGSQAPAPEARPTPAPVEARAAAEAPRPPTPPAAQTGAAAAAAPAAPAPATPVTAAPAPAPAPVEQSIAEQVVTRVSTLRLEAGRSELSIDLHPVDLGRIRVELTLEDGALHVALRAESGATGDLLRRAMPELRAALEEAGLGVADLHVGPDHRPDARDPGTSGPGADPSPTGTTDAAGVEPGTEATDPTDPSGQHGLDLLL